MKRKFLVTAALLFPLISFSQVIINSVTDLVQPSVTILRTEPEQPVEGKPLIVFFRFTNNNINGNALNGWIGADISSGTGYPGISDGDWKIIEMPNKSSVDGAVWLKTPDAGSNRTLRVFFYETSQPSGMNVIKSQPLYGIGEQQINIAALLNYSLETFTVNHTRARSTDTNFGSLYVAKNEQGVMQPVAVFMGDFQDGTYPFIAKQKDQPESAINTTYVAYSNPGSGNIANQLEMQKQQYMLMSAGKEMLQSGPFAIIPQQNVLLKISYFIYNGGSIEDHDGFLKGFAQATADPSLFQGKRPGSSDLFTAMRILNPFFNIIGACDGFVVGETLNMESDDLYSNTRNGNVIFENNYTGEAYESQVGCGNTSNYTVISRMEKISNPTDKKYNYDPGLTAYSGGRINLKEKSNYFFTPQRLETISAEGNLRAVTDPAYGYLAEWVYHAPSNISSSRLVVIRGNRHQLTIKGDELEALADKPKEEMTIIIQLLPGQLTMNPGLYNTQPSTTMEMKPKPVDTTTTSPVQMKTQTAEKSTTTPVEMKAKTPDKTPAKSNVTPTEMKPKMRRQN